MTISRDRLVSGPKSVSYDALMNTKSATTDHLTTPQIQRLVDRLADDLSRAYEPTASHLQAGSEPLRDACERYGKEAASGAISLEEALAGAIGALQGLFDRVGGHASDPATIIAAGIGLAAVSRAYQANGESNREAVEQRVEALPTQVARLRALHRINRTATANLKLSEMLETTVRVVAETTRSDACAVFLYDPATDSLALRAAVGLNPASVGALTIRAGSGITGRAAVEGRPVVAPDARTHEDFVSSAAFGDGVYTSQASVPMLYHGVNRLVGVLNILSVARRDFDDDDLAFLQTVAGELAISIENARLYSRTDARLRRKVAELGTLQRVSRTVASSLDLSHVLRLIAEAAVELINAEAAAIFRLPRPGDGQPAEQGPTIEYRVGQSRQVVDESGRNDFVLQVIESGGAQATEMQYLDGMGRLYCLPLRSARGNLGALCLRLAPGAELTEDELGLLQAFTDSASIAIENAELYQEARHSLETASTLLQEMHHRVRNNLQTVAALLSIQLRQLNEEPAAVHLREAVSRIQAIAAVHDLLSDERRLGGATVDSIARLVAEEAHSTLIPPGLRVEFEIPKSEIEVPSKQATVLALLTNELVSNAVSHGFRGLARGRVTIRAVREGNLARFEVANDGQRVPEGFNPRESRGLGMRIVQRLVSSDLRGEFAIQSTDEGTVAAITFPLLDR
ncbi:MAG: two-component system, sensor histidine kinase PdtaS [Thermomicrobiales bacterium]|nr:two-component system, sensor histidine kinase PdtaS [Thermomicrobiales bacterium]